MDTLRGAVSPAAQLFTAVIPKRLSIVREGPAAISTCKMQLALPGRRLFGAPFLSMTPGTRARNRHHRLSRPITLFSLDRLPSRNQSVRIALFDNLECHSIKGCKSFRLGYHGNRYRHPNPPSSVGLIRSQTGKARSFRSIAERRG